MSSSNEYLPVNSPSFMALISIYPPSSAPQQRERGCREKLTESDVPRMIPAHGKIPHHRPQFINPNISPNSLRFTRTVQAPNLLHLTPEFLTNYLLVFVPGVTDSSGEDNEVRVERAVVLELQPGLGELLDGRVVFESDLSVDDKLAGSVVCRKDQGQVMLGILKF